MLSLLVKWLALALSVFAAGYFLPGIHVPNYKVALLVALVFAVLNHTLRPILKLISFPITILTLGIFALVVNGFVFWLVPYFVKGFVIDTFVTAVVGAFVVSILSAILDHLLLGNDNKMGSE